MNKNGNESATAPKRARVPPGTAWKKGESGNPGGKQPGTLNKKTVLAMSLLAKDLEAVTQSIIKAALKGDMQAARFIVERMVPPMRERPISLELPTIDTLASISAAQQAILDAVARGDLLPGEGTTLAGIVEQRRKAIETEELEQRIAALEGAKK
jgi:hypothetical protein